MKKFFALALLCVGMAGTASASIYISTSCLGLASGPSVGYCAAGNYGNDCNHYATSGSQCAGTRTIIDNVGG